MTATRGSAVAHRPRVALCRCKLFCHSNSLKLSLIQIYIVE